MRSEPEPARRSPSDNPYQATGAPLDVPVPPDGRAVGIQVGLAFCAPMVVMIAWLLAGYVLWGRDPARPAIALLLGLLSLALVMVGGLQGGWGTRLSWARYLALAPLGGCFLLGVLIVYIIAGSLLMGLSGPNWNQEDLGIFAIIWSVLTLYVLLMALVIRWRWRVRTRRYRKACEGLEAEAPGTTQP